MLLARVVEGLSVLVLLSVVREGGVGYVWL